MNPATAYQNPLISAGLWPNTIETTVRKRFSLKIRGVAERLWLSPTISTAKHLTRFVIAFASASLSYLAEQIGKLIRILLNPLPQPHKIANSNPSKNAARFDSAHAAPPVPLNLQHMPQKFLINTLTYLSLQDLASCAKVSKGLKVCTEMPDPWDTWAIRLSMPWENDKDVRKKMISLLTYFQIPSSSRQVTTLKNKDKIAEALAVYPMQAKVLIPNLETKGFQLYYRNNLGDCHLLNVEGDDPFADNREEALNIFNDPLYIELETIK